MILRNSRHAVISVGQWVCGSSILNDHLCDKPRKVVEVHDGRITYEDRNGVRRWFQRHTIKFICDSKEEGERMYTLSTKRSTDLDVIRRQYETKVDQLIRSIND
jgi:hypothetical protein